MLRITRTPGDGPAVLKLEGKLLAPWVEEVRQAVLDAGRRSAAGMPTALDLSGVTFVDAEGADLLRHLLAGGVRLCDCSNFVRELLRARKD